MTKKEAGFVAVSITLGLTFLGGLGVALVGCTGNGSAVAKILSVGDAIPTPKLTEEQVARDWKNYLGQRVQMTGKIRIVWPDDKRLAFVPHQVKIWADFPGDVSSFKEGQTVTVEGKVGEREGYMVPLTECKLVK